MPSGAARHHTPVWSQTQNGSKSLRCAVGQNLPFPSPPAPSRPLPSPPIPHHKEHPKAPSPKHQTSFPSGGDELVWERKAGQGGYTYCLEQGTLWGLRSVQGLRRGLGRAAWGRRLWGGRQLGKRQLQGKSSWVKRSEHAVSAHRNTRMLHRPRRRLPRITTRSDASTLRAGGCSEVQSPPSSLNS